MISKMRTREDGGSRLAIVFNASPLFNEGAFNKPTKQRTGNVSEIRRWLLENDWLEAVVALPDQLFYNTGISTYFWIVTNRKRPERRGKVQLIDARESYAKMRKSLGEKRKQISGPQITDIVRLYEAFEENDRCIIFDNEDFGFLRITVERPLRLRWEVTDLGIETLRRGKQLAKLGVDAAAALISAMGHHLGSSYDDVEVRRIAGEAMQQAGLKGKPIENAIVDAFAVTDPGAPIATDRSGKPVPDANLRDAESVPLSVEVAGRLRYEPDVGERLATQPYRRLAEEYVENEVHPYVPDAWIDHSRTRIGYEIPLPRHFYEYVPPRPLEEIDAEIKAYEEKIRSLLAEVTE